uniref:dUTPase-like domain-containing protein n=1 Tax=Pseudonaja textilis TaxID=8673 RepID=A0A670XQU4_PSETE
MKLAKENATSECRRAIIGLGANPDLPEMIKACQDVGTASYQTNFLVAALSQENTPAATRGSAGIDLILQEEVNFKFPGEVQVVPSQLSGPLPQNCVGLVLPRSSMGKKGIFVIPGAIDSDYTGIIYVQLNFRHWSGCFSDFCQAVA